MCDPITMMAAAAALTGGSNFIAGREKKKNADRAKTAVNTQFQLEQARQKDYRTRSQADFDKTLSSFTPEAQNNTIGDMVTNRQTTIANNAPAAAQFGALPDSASNIVKSDIAHKIADSVARANQQGSALAKVSAPSDLFQTNQISLKKGATDIGTINDFSRNSATLNPYEQQEAMRESQKHTGADTFADLLGLAGQVTGMAAGGGMGMPGGIGGKKVATGDQLPWRDYTFGYDTGAQNRSFF